VAKAWKNFVKLEGTCEIVFFIVKQHFLVHYQRWGAHWNNKWHGIL